MEAAAAAMDFHTLSRRELQALCKRNGIRANMTNVAMAEALQGLTSVDGIDEIGTTLCLPTPGRSAMKSAAKMVAVVEEQQHGSPLPRGRRVSVKSPEAIRMEVEGGEGEVKEIVKTPGVALRSTRRGPRATPAPLPTPAPAASTRATARRTAARKTVEVVPTPATRRSQRTASRKAAGAVEADRPAEDVPEEKTSKMTIALDQEAEVVEAAPKDEKVQEDELIAAFSDVKFDDSKEETVQEDEPKDEKCDDPNEEEKVRQEEPKAALSDEKCDDTDEEEKVHQEEPKAVASDVKCDDPEEEVTKFLDEDSKREELEEGEEGIVKEEEPTSADSPILGVIGKELDASVEDCEDLAEFSPAREMTHEIIPVTEDKEVAISEETLTEDNEVAINEEAVEEGEDDLDEDEEWASDDDDESTEEDGSTDESDEDTDETKEENTTGVVQMLQGTDKEVAISEETLTENNEVAINEEAVKEGEDEEWASDDDDESTEEDGSTDESDEDTDETNEENTTGVVQMLQGTDKEVAISEETLTEDNEVAINEEAVKEGEDDLDEDEEWASDDDDESTEEDGSTESDEYTDETNEETTTGAVQMLQGTGMVEEANKVAFSEDDDFSGDLPSECDNMMIFSDAETESDIAYPVLEENQAVVASATKSAKPHDDSAIKQEEGPEEADATEEVDNIVKSLDEFTFKEGASEEMQKQQPQDYNRMSLRKLRSTYKKFVAAKQEGKQEEVTDGKRLPLEEVDENTCINH